jgi:hypothetical protein
MLQIRSPLAPLNLNKEGIRVKVPLIKGDLGGSTSVAMTDGLGISGASIQRRINPIVRVQIFTERETRSPPFPS